MSGNDFNRCEDCGSVSLDAPLPCDCGQTRAKQDASDHAEYTFQLIEMVLAVAKFLYKAAYIHGHKHGREGR